MRLPRYSRGRRLRGAHHLTGCSAASPRSTLASIAALDLRDVIDVRRVVGIGARLAAEPGVEDLPELGLRGRPQADRERVRVVPLPRAVGRLGVEAEGGAHPGDLVCRDRRAGPRPAAHHRLLGAALGDVARRRLARPGPVVSLALGEGAVRDRLVPTLAKLLDDRLGDSYALVGGNGYSHEVRLLGGW